MATGGILARFMLFEEIYNNGNSGTAKTIDWKNGNIQKLTLNGQCTLTYSNQLTGLHTLIVSVDGVGKSLAFPSGTYWASMAPTYVNNHVFIVEAYYDGYYYYNRFVDFGIVP